MPPLDSSENGKPRNQGPPSPDWLAEPWREVRLSKRDDQQSLQLPGLDLFEYLSAHACTTQSAELPKLFKDNLARVDTDNDGKMESAEIDAALADSSYTGKDAQLLALLKVYEQQFRELNNDTGPDDGITSGDIGVFGRLTSDSNLSALQQEFLQNISAGLAGTANRIENASRGLYGSGEWSESICPDAVVQGKVGNCSFLSAVASLSATNPEAIARMITPNADGSFTVTFPGDKEHPVTVKAPTDGELALFSKVGGRGIWPAVLEKAYGQYLGGTVLPQEATVSGAFFRRGLSLISPNGSCSEYSVPDISDDDLLVALQEAVTNRCPITAVVDDANCEDEVEVSPSGLPVTHEYSVLKFDRETRQLTLRNPWGCVEPLKADGTARDGVDDGVFEMTLAEFRENFRRIAMGN
jgi:hypothetical protein